MYENRLQMWVLYRYYHKLLCANNANGIFRIIIILIFPNNMKLEWNSIEGKQQKPHVLDISSFNLNILRLHILISFILFYKPKTSQLSHTVILPLFMNVCMHIIVYMNEIQLSPVDRTKYSIYWYMHCICIWRLPT